MSAQNGPHRWVVDSIEESMASIEIDDGKMISIPASLLPKGAREGDVLSVTIEIDAAATKKALAESSAQVQKHAKQANDPGGDIVL